MGFQPNPFDLCVVNKIINGSQMTVTWHVGDPKVSHKKPRQIDEVVENLKQIYRNEKIEGEQIYEYLAICLDYLEKT